MSKVDRRKFIGTAVAAGAAVAAGGSALGQIASIAAQGVGKDALSKLGWDSFLPFVGTDFTFGEGQNGVVLRLVAVDDNRPLGSKARKLGMESFTLKFTGLGRSPLTQNTYRVNHFNLGDFDLFITEGGQKGRLNIYYANINRVTVAEDQ